MSLSYRHSIRKKLIGLFTATASVTVLVACSALWVYQFLNYRTSLRAEEWTMAQLVADSSAPALLFDDAHAADETLAILRADTRIRMACLYNKHGGVIAHFAAVKGYQATCPKAPTYGAHFTLKHLTIVRSIKAEGDLVGELYLEVGLTEMYTLLAHLAVMGLCVLVTASLLALGISSVLQRLISDPILALTRVAVAVSRDGNYLLRARRGSDDETGLLIDQFNVMMGQIQQRETELQNAHASLEDKVKERTAALSNEIVERKIVERDLEAAKLVAEESSLAKSAFLATMSHELRTPLNAIIGYSEMLHEEAAEAGLATMSGDLDKVLSSAHHLLSLISDILDFSKIEAGQMQMYPEQISTADLLADVLATAEVLARRNRNRLVVVEPVWKGLMTVDALRFRQCLLNLISNACKFTEDGTVSIAIEKRLERDQSWIVWMVRDTGIGIPPEDQAKLFLTFSQVDASATRRYGGSGLGLAISQQLCHAMNGYITVESASGAGSTFAIHMPDQPLDASGHDHPGEDVLSYEGAGLT